MNPLLEVVTQLASARASVDKAFDVAPRPWDPAVSGNADAMLEHLDHALDAAIITAIASGVTVREIEPVVGDNVVRPEWFEL